jgi:hypothetical protein
VEKEPAAQQIGLSATELHGNGHESELGLQGWPDQRELESAETNLLHPVNSGTKEARARTLAQIIIKAHSPFRLPRPPPCPASSRNQPTPRSPPVST